MTLLGVIGRDRDRGCGWGVASVFIVHPYAEHWLTPQRRGGAIYARGRQIGHVVPDAESAAHPVSNFVGGEPEAWTRWVLDVLGYQSGADVDDLYPRSGAIQRAAAMRLRASKATWTGNRRRGWQVQQLPICLLRARLAVTGVSYLSTPRPGWPWPSLDGVNSRPPRGGGSPSATCGGCENAAR